MTVRAVTACAGGARVSRAAAARVARVVGMGSRFMGPPVCVGVTLGTCAWAPGFKVRHERTPGLEAGGCAGGGG
ncbi:hypothetical protein GCM10008961_01980 [Deinococcus knuensis]|uniref:Uncharacterized protein n=1 Tax=Deinococcus knuensis TaxID=1837380 RepID=A0ABQ2SDL4_9DEIO|nr:hypothetical protein GCM10008961_01980 [Deinococcus knuensis]